MTGARMLTSTRCHFRQRSLSHHQLLRDAVYQSVPAGRCHRPGIIVHGQCRGCTQVYGRNSQDARSRPYVEDVHSRTHQALQRLQAHLRRRVQTGTESHPGIQRQDDVIGSERFLQRRPTWSDPQTLSYTEWPIVIFPGLSPVLVLQFAKSRFGNWVQSSQIIKEFTDALSLLRRIFAPRQIDLDCYLGLDGRRVHLVGISPLLQDHPVLISKRTEDVGYGFGGLTIGDNANF